MIDVREARIFDDVAAVVGPRNPASNVCFCLSYRLPSKEANALREPQRSARVRELCAEEFAPGVIAYDDGVPVGWAAVQPRSRTTFARSRVIPHVDDREAWSIWCFRVVAGYRGRGILPHLLDGAVAYARASGAPVVEGYPLDNAGEQIHPTMAYVGTRALFERAGFEKAADTTSVLSGFPRVIMRRELNA